MPTKILVIDKLERKTNIISLLNGLFKKKYKLIFHPWPSEGNFSTSLKDCKLLILSFECVSAAVSIKKLNEFRKMPIIFLSGATEFTRAIGKLQKFVTLGNTWKLCIPDNKLLSNVEDSIAKVNHQARLKTTLYSLQEQLERPSPFPDHVPYYRQVLNLETKIKTTNKQLQKSNQELLDLNHNFLKASLYSRMNPGPLLQSSFAGIIIDCNPATIKILGEVKNKAICETLSMSKAELQAIIKSGTSFQKDFLLGQKYFTLLFQPIPEQQIVYIFGTDITQRKIAEKKLKQANQDLREVDKLKSVFLSMTSHELKTPIVPIKIQAENLLSEIQGKLNPQQRESVAMIARNIDHLNSLLSDVLDSAKLEADKMKMFPTKIDLNKLFHETIQDTQSIAQGKNITIESNLPTLPIVQIDEKRLRQVLLNLIYNAIKFTSSGGSVTVAATIHKKEIEVSITDTGIGIEAKMLTKIFTKFVQVHPSYKQKEKGTGLGLSICKGIVTKFGGKITANSQGKNKGATFTFTIPTGKL